MNDVRKLMLYRQAIVGLKGVENMFGEQVLQKEQFELSKDDVQFFCEICNSIQSIMQRLFDHTEAIHKMTEVQFSFCQAMVDEKISMIDSIISMAHIQLHENGR